MSQEDIKKYFEYVASHTDSLKSLASAKSADEVFKNAVRDGAALGFRFTEAQVSEWMRTNLRPVPSNGELHDEQLEAIAGGDDFSRWLPQGPWYENMGGGSPEFQALLDDCLRRAQERGLW